jgi:hypothetical protein
MPYKDPLKAKEFQRKRYLKHQEFKKQYMKKWRLKNKHLYNADKVKDKLLLTTYKISLKEYQQKLMNQNDCCAMCKRHKSNFKKGLHVDHDHKTGKVRDLLCSVCNMNVGVVENKLEIILKYIKKHNKKLN